MKNLKKGFTLTELLITIALIGILAAIAVPRYLQNESAYVSEAVSQLSVIRISEENYKTDSGIYLDIDSGGDCPPPGGYACENDGGGTPKTWAAMGVTSPNTATGRFDYRVETNVGSTEFCAIASRKAGSDNEFQTVCVDNLGEFSGTHPDGPNSAGAPASSWCGAAGPGYGC